MESINKAINQLFEDQMLKIDEDWKKSATAGALAAGMLLNPMAADASKTTNPNTTSANQRSDDKGRERRQGEIAKDQQRFIKAIAGEAGNQGYLGMLAIASAIWNRAVLPYFHKDPLKGVFGVTNPVVSKYNEEIMNKARDAWINSKDHDTVDGAQFWGNASDVGKWQRSAKLNPKHWFNHVVFVKQVKDHYFYKEKENEPRRSDRKNKVAD